MNFVSDPILNQGSPLDCGLSFCAPLQDNCLPFITELVHAREIPIRGEQGPLWEETCWGPSLRLNSSSFIEDTSQYLPDSQVIFTLAMWFKTSSSNSWLLGWEDFAIGMNKAGSTKVLSSRRLTEWLHCVSDNRWHFLVYRHSGTVREVSIDLWRDRMYRKEVDTDPIRKDRFFVGSERFEGLLSKLYIWDRYLSDSECSILYGDPYILWRPDPSRIIPNSIMPPFDFDYAVGTAECASDILEPESVSVMNQMVGTIHSRAYSPKVYINCKKPELRPGPLQTSGNQTPVEILRLDPTSTILKRHK